MRTAIRSICVLLPTLFLRAYGEQSVWDKHVTAFDYDHAQTALVLRDLEQISQGLDSAGGHGITFIMPTRYWWSDSSLTIHLTNATLKELAQYVAELYGGYCVFGDRSVYWCGFQMTGPPGYHRAGVVGRVLDHDSQTPITNAAFATDSDITNSVLFLPDGRFVAAVDYHINRPFCDSVYIYREEDDHFTMTVSAPGYETKAVEVTGGDREANQILIEMKKCQPAARPYGSPATGSPSGQP